MEQEKHTSAPLLRITVVDALRGFALLGVVITHMLQHYSIFSFGGIDPGEALFPRLDAAIRWLLQNVIQGKFINIFAFLFGLSFFIQMDRASKKGVDFRKRFLWRMVILFAIGVVGNCFYTGDILSIYAVFGIVMVFLYKLKNWLLIVFASLLLIGTPRIVTTTYNQMTRTEQTIVAGAAPNQGNNQNNRVRPESRVVEKSSFFSQAKNNLTIGLEGKLNYQFGMFARGYITMALFILGLIVGRLRFFEEAHLKRRKNVMLFGCFIAAILAINLIVGLFPEQPSMRMFMRPGGVDMPFSLFTLTALNNIKTVLVSGALVMGFIVLYQLKGVGSCLNILSPYGRMGLSNYEAQGVIGCLIFSPWAFGSIFGGLGTTEVFALGLVVYAAQVIVSMYWLKYYLYGPLEWFWRSATYLKLQPLRRQS